MIGSNIRHSPRILLVLTGIVAGLLFASCTGHIGYGVINWSAPQYGLTAGDIVPVFIQSNIGKVYVIGTARGKRAELPLWQLTLYKSKSRARKAAAALEEYRYTYASVKLDGLPMRALPENTARQVYRLRVDQKVKVVRKGEGTPVLAGNSPLEGDWLEVMADDGSTGWCFSYNLTLFDERKSAVSVSTGASGSDAGLESLTSSFWYPDSYRTKIQDNRVDISRINPRWGFFPGKDAGIARIETEDGVVTFPFSSIVKADEGFYRFEGSSLSVQVKSESSIMVQYTDADGMPHSLYFSTLDTTPDELIETEKARRAEIMDGIRKVGPQFASGNYGVIRILAGGKFLWSGYQLLSPSINPAGSGAGGAVDVRCFLPDGIASGYDGVISFRFDGTENWINFLYALSGKGLKLEYLSDSNIDKSVVISRALTPTVVFFTPDKSVRGGR